MSASVNAFPFSEFRLVPHVPFPWHGDGMLRIQRQANGEVIFILSGRMDSEHIAELAALIAAEGKDRRIILDLKDMTLTGQEGITFLAQCETEGIGLANCDAYVREWIATQSNEG